MKKINIILALVLCFLVMACTEDNLHGDAVDTGGEALLDMYVNFASDNSLRLAELPNVDSINEGGVNGLKNLGLYVYYEEDYNANILSRPYIRNMECMVQDGKIVPVLAEGEPESNKNIYIYDKMVIVAFYPYNAEMSETENFFNYRSDEENYPITRADYSEQTYIPYRGIARANPTNSYYIEMTLYPKHTFRMEIILVSEDEADFDDGNPDIKVLPAIDPVDNNDLESDGKRERWYDYRVEQPNNGGGMHVRRYVAYLWQDDVMNHIIEQDDVLYENGNFTLLATEQVNPREQRVYRYGYNFTTGESFIPTSSNLINDAETLQSANLTNAAGYQVCDIDLAGHGDFTPLRLLNATYDGGGHKISNMTINSSANEVGLFGQIQGNSYLKNVNLIDPVITVNSTSDTCYVGAICGHLNSPLDAEALAELYASMIFPDNLSEVVKEALIAEILAGIYNSQSQIIACRVENPQITVTGTNPNVGTFCGSNGDTRGDNNFQGVIWDSYTLGGSITVNAGNEINNADAYIGGFCGLNQYYITRCFATIDAGDITARKEETIDNGDGSTSTVLSDFYQGFAWQGTEYGSTEGAGIDDCFAMAPDTNAGVALLPGSWPSGWVQYTGIWPINTSTWTSYSGNSFWYDMGTAGSVYPTLQWERR